MIERMIPMLLIGIALVVGGVYIFFNRRFHDWKYGWIDMGAHHAVIGVIYVIVGSVFIYVVVRWFFRRRREKN